MADRYWIGGTGSWNSTAKWSATSGGAGGASLPTSSDNVFFDSNSSVGAFTSTVNATSNCLNFTASELSGVMTLAGSSSLFVRGDFFIPATNFTSTITGNLNLSPIAADTTNTANFNGNVMVNDITLGSGGGSANRNYIMLSGITTSGTISHAGIETSAIDMGGFTYTCARYTAGSRANITMGAGSQILITGTTLPISFGNDLLFINDPENANFILTNVTTTGRTLALGNNTYGRIEIGGATGTSTVTITGSATIGELACSKTVASTIRFTDGTTQAIERWTASGTAGKLLTLSGTSTGGWAVNCTSPYFVDAEYLSISYSTATPADTWFAGETSTNGGNNSGWTFAPAEDNFMVFFPAAGA